MIFQRVLKGVPAKTHEGTGLSDSEVEGMLDGRGLISNWWRKVGIITHPQIIEKLSEEALLDHLVNYESVRDETPFISTTAGTVERDVSVAENVYFPPLYTALRFATNHFKRDGYVFYAYLFVLGRKSIEMEEFAEEVRDVNTYTSYYAWHPEGEVVAKIHIPARRIEKVEKYSHLGLEERLDHGEVPRPQQTFSRPDVYRDPWNYANVRGFPEVP